MHYYQFNIGDYVTSTQHLEPMEDLAYRRMLDLYYQKEMPLPLELDKLARLVRMRNHSDSITFVLDEFFTKEDDGYHNDCADRVLASIYAKSAKAKASSDARWAKVKKIKELELCERNAIACETQCSDDAIGMLPNTYNLIPNTQDTISNKDSSSNSKELTEKVVKSKFKFSEDDMTFATWMFGLVEIVSPSAKKPNFESWANVIRLMRESDGFEHRHMAETFKWANQDSFWYVNILSPKKLREKFAQLDAKRMQGNGGSNEKTINGYAQQGKKLSAAERIRTRNEQKYGQSSGGLAMAEDGGNIRGTMDQGEWRGSIIDVDSCPE